MELPGELAPELPQSLMELSQVTWHQNTQSLMELSQVSWHQNSHSH